MTSGHFAHELPPNENPLTSRFWIEHQQLTIRASDPKVEDFRSDLLDFTHAEVRGYRMAQVSETIDRYATDGFEMDFTPARESPAAFTSKKLLVMGQAAFSPKTGQSRFFRRVA